MLAYDLTALHIAMNANDPETVRQKSSFRYILYTDIDFDVLVIYERANVSQVASFLKYETSTGWKSCKLKLFSLHLLSKAKKSCITAVMS